MRQHTTPTGAFLADCAAEKKWFFDKGLATGLIELFQGKSVGDFGAGIGLYTKHLSRHGVRCRGYDGIPNVEELSHGSVEHCDLARPIAGVPVFDWCLCLEVMEHIPVDYERTALTNLHEHTRLGLVISWATPEQLANPLHINCRPNQYVIENLTGRGYAYDADTSVRLRNAADIWWFRDTIMVFQREGQS